MASIIKADDGVASGQTGIVYTADTSGTLELQATSGVVTMQNLTGGLGIPVGTTAQRPINPANGYIRINSSTLYVEAYYNNTWYNLQYIGVITATGGTVTTSGNYKIHTFNSSSNFIVSDAPAGAILEVLLIGGGGAGGTGYGGGGGGGGYYYNSTMPVAIGTYSITIGAGGTNVAGSLKVGTSGGNTIFNSQTAAGGGGGGEYNASAVAKAGDGGCGGGAGGVGTSVGNTGSGSQGGNGGVGAGTSISNAVGGGGGGSGAAGGAASGTVAGTGGIGYANPIIGSTSGQLVSSTYYVAGGGGGGGGSGTAGSGGSGGGGAGQIIASNGLLPDVQSFSSWTFNNASIASSNNTAPDGTSTGSILNFTTSAWDMHYNRTGLSAGSTYYFTIWVKLGTATNFCIVMNNTTAWNSISGNKAYTAADGLSTSSWTRIVHQFTATSGVNIHLGGHAESITQQTAGTVHMWGAMLYTTQPTQATSGTVNTGGGGGGSGAWNTGYGGNGGSGIAVIRYRYQ